MNLPFLKPKAWPQKVKISGESHYGFSEDDELLENALHEFMQAYESKNHEALLEALNAMVHIIHTKESHAIDAQ